MIKKITLTIILMLCAVLFLAACGGLADEIDRLENERYRLIAMNDEQIQIIADLTDLIAEIEEQQDIQSTIHDEILDSFMENLDSVAEFLGIHDLYIAREDIVLQGNFVEAQSTFFGGGVSLFFRYWTWQDEIEWVLLEYIVGPIGGPGFITGRPWWACAQEDMFEESFTMRIYRHWDYLDGPQYDNFYEEVLPMDWQGQVIYHMHVHLGIQIAGVWFEGSRLVVDLTPAGAVPFNWGSFGGTMLSNSLFDSLATLPNVTEVEVLVGGQRRVSSDHFNF